MTRVDLIRCMAEAQRFIATAQQALERLAKEGHDSVISKETAAARRASMDLTRALAELRRPQR